MKKRNIYLSILFSIVLCMGLLLQPISSQAEENEITAPVLTVHDENGCAVLGWSAVEGAEQYFIYRKLTNDFSVGDSYAYATVDPSVTTYRDTRIISDYYYYQVMAYLDGQRIVSNVVRYDQPIAAVTAIKAAATQNKRIILGFQAGAGQHDGYEIYRSETGAEGSYTLLKSITDEYDFDWELDEYDIVKSFPNGCVLFGDYNVQIGGTYYYQIRAYDVREGQTVYGAFSNVINAQIVLKAVEDLRAVSASYTSLKLTWDKLSDAQGYIIKRSLTEGGVYEEIADITRNNTVKYTDKNLTCGVTYYYQICGYTVVNGVKVYGQTGLTAFAVPQLDKVKSMTAKTKTPTKMTVSWKAVTGAQGYIIYQKSGKKDYKKLKVTSASNRTAKLKVRNGVAYQFKIVAYRMANGTKAMGQEAEFTAYGDYYGYEAESYDSKYTRIYKKGSEYKSDKEARKHMTTIKVKVWDFKQGMSGAKITRTKYITCNKAIAPTLKKIFNKIYHGKEKAPIYEVGCYSWRSGQHGQGLAVDINANYNAMFDNGKPKVGKYWNPKKYAYSIKRNGDIENAFAEYGFPRGIWGDRKDYMHFSYFGI